MRILNRKTCGTLRGIYIGRRRGAPMHWGNPFTHLRGVLNTIVVPTRDNAVYAYGEWLAGTHYRDIEQDRRQWILDNVHTLRGHDLICWCAPERCHGELLRDLANMDDPTVPLAIVWTSEGEIALQLGDHG